MQVQQQFETVDACRFCFMCRHVCTMGLATGWESDTPRGRALILFKILRGHAHYNEELVESISRCCLCGMCQTWCKGGYTPPAAILLARQDIVAQGKQPEGARRIKQNILTSGNPFGLPAAERFQSLELDGSEHNPGNGEVLLYVGCDTAYHRPEIANALLRILRQATVRVRLLEEEASSGKPLSVLGYRAEAQQLRRTLAEKIKQTGCRTLVTACPSSFDAFKNDFPELGIDLNGIEVLHASQYLDRLLSDGRLATKKPLDRVVTVLDSDRLGRFNGIYDPPRRLVSAIPGVELREMSWTRELAHSCAETGGVMRLLHPELLPALADRVRSEAAEVGAEVLATSCPITKQTLLECGSPGIEVRDVVELVADALA